MLDNRVRPECMATSEHCKDPGMANQLETQCTSTRGAHSATSSGHKGSNHAEHRWLPVSYELIVEHGGVLLYLNQVDGYGWHVYEHDST